MSRARRLGSVSFHIARYVSTIVVASAMSNLLGVVECICWPLSPRTRRPAITCEVKRAGSRRHCELVTEDVLRRMHLEALDALVVEGEDRAPHRLHDGPIVLHDLLELHHQLASCGHVERALGHRQDLVELRVGVLRLVPRHARAVGEGQAHDAERPMRPRREAEWDLGPHFPVLRRRHHVDLYADAGFLPLLDHRLYSQELPGWLRP